jgi:ferredoxin
MKCQREKYDREKCIGNGFCNQTVARFRGLNLCQKCYKIVIKKEKNKRYVENHRNNKNYRK